MHGFVDHRQIVYHIASTFLLIGMHCLWKIYVPMQIHCKKPSVCACIHEVTAQRVKYAIYQIHSVKTYRLDMPIVRSSHKGQTIIVSSISYSNRKLQPFFIYRKHMI